MGCLERGKGKERKKEINQRGMLGLTQVGRDIQNHGHEDIQLGDGGLAKVARIGINLPILVKGQAAPKQDGEEDDEPGHGDEAEADVDAGAVAQEIGREAEVEDVHAEFQQPIRALFY